MGRTKTSAADQALKERVARAMQVWHTGRRLYPLERVADNYMAFAGIALKEFRSGSRPKRNGDVCSGDCDTVKFCLP